MKSGIGMLRVLRSGVIAAFAAAALFAPSVMATWPAAGERICGSSFCDRCGDGFCSKRCGETAANCPKDCGVISE